MIAVMEPLSAPGNRVSNGVRFQAFFGPFATADFGSSAPARGAR